MIFKKNTNHENFEEILKGHSEAINSGANSYTRLFISDGDHFSIL